MTKDVFGDFFGGFFGEAGKKVCNHVGCAMRGMWVKTDRDTCLSCGEDLTAGGLPDGPFR